MMSSPSISISSLPDASIDLGTGTEKKHSKPSTAASTDPGSYTGSYTGIYAMPPSSSVNDLDVKPFADYRKPFFPSSFSSFFKNKGNNQSLTLKDPKKEFFKPPEKKEPTMETSVSQSKITGIGRSKVDQKTLQSILN